MSSPRPKKLSWFVFAIMVISSAPTWAKGRNPDKEAGVFGGLVGTTIPEPGDPFAREHILVPKNDAGGLDLDRAYLSESREGLPGERLYEALSRPDLVERFRQRKRARRALLGTGIGLITAGILIALPVTAVGGIQASYSDNKNLVIGGGTTLAATVGVGTVLTVIGAIFKSRPIGPRATRRLIDRYNASRSTDSESDEP